MTDRATRIVQDILNRDTSTWWPETTCALIVRIARALVDAGVIKGAEKEKEE